MRYTFVTLIILLLSLPTLAFAASDLKVTMDASIEQPVSPEGQPVMLALTLHNAGTERIIIGGSRSEPSAFKISITDGAGRAVPHTALGDRVLTPPMSGSVDWIIGIDPGQVFRYRFNLARLFDLSHAGDYSVNVRRTVWRLVLPRPVVDPPPQEMMLTAGPLKIHLAEDAASASGPMALSLPPARRTFLYMASQYSPGVARYHVGDEGDVSLALTAPPPASYPPPPAPSLENGVMSLAATPDGRFLYAGDGASTVSQFRIGADGELSPLSPPTVTAQKAPGFLLMDPKGRFLLAMSGEGSTLYAIGRDGRLTETERVASGDWGRSAVHAVLPGYFAEIGPTGTFLYDQTGGAYRLAPDGRVGPLIPQEGSAAGPNVERPNALALSPSGRFAFTGVSTKGYSGGFDLVVPMRVAADGTLAPIPGGAVTPQAPPLPSPGFQPFLCTTLMVDPTGRFLIVLNPGYLDCYRIGPDGLLTPLGMTTQNGNMTAVYFVPGGHIAYVLNRNQPSLLAYRIDEEHGLIPSGLNMPSGVPFAASITSAVAPTPPKWGEAVGGLQVSARMEREIFPSDAPVVLTVVLKNVTARPVRLGAAGADMASFRLSLTGPSRRFPGSFGPGGEPTTASIPLLAAGDDLLDRTGPSTAPLLLPPGGQRQYRLVLSRLADLTVAGNYTVQVTRILPSGAAATAPTLPLVLEGPYDGVLRNEQGQELDVF